MATYKVRTVSGKERVEIPDGTPEDGIVAAVCAAASAEVTRIVGIGYVAPAAKPARKVDIPPVAQVNRMNKPGLQRLAKRLGIDQNQTVADLRIAIAEVMARREEIRQGDTVDVAIKSLGDVTLRSKI